jgi:spore germination cell wall hydrolase CwlJ-like protein
LAVAQVVLNRAASGRYPAGLCDVIKQHAQFSFIRKGEIPAANKNSAAWRKAVAIAHIARDKLASEVAPNILWYHASYVAPKWRRRLTREAKIGLHIFYS